MFRHLNGLKLTDILAKAAAAVLRPGYWRSR